MLHTWENVLAVEEIESKTNIVFKLGKAPKIQPCARFRSNDIVVDHAAAYVNTTLLQTRRRFIAVSDILDRICTPLD